MSTGLSRLCKVVRRYEQHVMVIVTMWFAAWQSGWSSDVLTILASMGFSFLVFWSMTLSSRERFMIVEDSDDDEEGGWPDTIHGIPFVGYLDTKPTSGFWVPVPENSAYIGLDYEWRTLDLCTTRLCIKGHGIVVWKWHDTHVSTLSELDCGEDEDGQRKCIQISKYVLGHGCLPSDLRIFPLKQLSSIDQDLPSQWDTLPSIPLSSYDKLFPPWTRRGHAVLASHRCVQQGQGHQGWETLPPHVLGKIVDWL